jgi:hypothetical protein
MALGRPKLAMQARRIATVSSGALLAVLTAMVMAGWSRFESFVSRTKRRNATVGDPQVSLFASG